MINRKITLVFSVVVLLLGLSAVSLYGDMMRMNNGQTLDGDYLGGDSRSIQFRVRGIARTYQLSEVDQIQFTDTQGLDTGVNQDMVPFANSFLDMMRPREWQITDMGDLASIYPRDR